MTRVFLILAAVTLMLCAGALTGCASSPAPKTAGSTAVGYYPQNPSNTRKPQMTPIPRVSGFDYDTRGLELPDRAAFLQKDKRWASDRLGNTASDTMGSDGCLVTASAMALKNLGFQTDPGDLNKRLTAADSFTPRGWLIWSGISKVTGGKATLMCQAFGMIMNFIMRIFKPMSQTIQHNIYPTRPMSCFWRRLLG